MVKVELVFHGMYFIRFQFSEILVLHSRKVRCVSFKSSHGGVLCKNLFLKISENSQKNTCARVCFFNEVVFNKPLFNLRKQSSLQIFGNRGHFVDMPQVPYTQILKIPISIDELDRAVGFRMHLTILTAKNCFIQFSKRIHWNNKLGFFFICLHNQLKSDSRLRKKFVLFASMKALYKWWKMLFISSWKLFSFSRYLSSSLDFLVM